MIPEEPMKIFSLNANRPLAEKIAAELDQPLGKCTVKQFSDGEIAINIEETVRGFHVFVIQATNDPVNDRWLELLIMIDALKRASAKTINVVMPYYGYARQDRTTKPREPITAKLVANMLVKAGASRVLTLDLHTVQVQGFFDIPVDNLFTVPLFSQYYLDKNLDLENLVVVAPKNSGISRSRSLANDLDVPIAIIDYAKDETGASFGYIIGEVQDKICIMIDDICNTGVTFSRGSQILAEAGAKEIYACASHAIFSKGAKERIAESPIKELCVTDSVLVDAPELKDKLVELSCSALMAEAIRRIHTNTPMSPLFKLSKSHQDKK
ncbi:ribose-phosphate diphosphokinase [Enterococcus nangangensis]|uniref:ribose-phosphate diphosphokinase n=1 Tax=Enterococcus nangangensis TaxID=2559926 RepID=UPI0010F47B2D|nr:ribose-phosphate diphosphokinase [Enterococcus nangangensis]